MIPAPYGHGVAEMIRTEVYLARRRPSPIVCIRISMDAHKKLMDYGQSLMWVPDPSNPGPAKFDGYPLVPWFHWDRHVRVMTEDDLHHEHGPDWRRFDHTRPPPNGKAIEDSEGGGGGGGGL